MRLLIFVKRFLYTKSYLNKYLCLIFIIVLYSSCSPTAYILDKQPKNRWDFVFGLASKVKRCGEENDDGCGCHQPTKIRKEGFSTILAENPSDDKILFTEDALLYVS